MQFHWVSLSRSYMQANVSQFTYHWNNYELLQVKRWSKNSKNTNSHMLIVGLD